MLATTNDGAGSAGLTSSPSMGNVSSLSGTSSWLRGVGLMVHVSRAAVSALRFSVAYAWRPPAMLFWMASRRTVLPLLLCGPHHAVECTPCTAPFDGGPDLRSIRLSAPARSYCVFKRSLRTPPPAMQEGPGKVPGPGSADQTGNRKGKPLCKNTGWRTWPRKQSSPDSGRFRRQVSSNFPVRSADGTRDSCAHQGCIGDECWGGFAFYLISRRCARRMGTPLLGDVHLAPTNNPLQMPFRRRCCSVCSAVHAML